MNCSQFCKETLKQACPWLLRFRAGSDPDTQSAALPISPLQCPLLCPLPCFPASSAVTWMFLQQPQHSVSCLFLHTGTHTGLHDIPLQTPVIPCWKAAFQLYPGTWGLPQSGPGLPLSPSCPHEPWPWPLHASCSSFPPCTLLSYLFVTVHAGHGFLSTLFIHFTNFPKVSANGDSSAQIFPSCLSYN